MQDLEVALAELPTKVLAILVEESAEEMAYQYAVEEYEMYEGYHGILDWYDVAENNNLDPDDENNESEIDELYNEEKESWMEYYAVLTEEDDLEDEEITEL